VELIPFCTQTMRAFLISSCNSCSNNNERGCSKQLLLAKMSVSEIIPNSLPLITGARRR
jgi:hypothetical protein